MNLSLEKQWSELQNRAFQLWESKIAPRYHALDEREQRTVRLASIALPLIIFVFGILLPAAEKNSQLRAEVAALTLQAQEANQLADALARNPQQTRTNPQGSALSDVDKIARQTGIRSFMSTLRPQQSMGGGSRLQTHIKDAPYDKVALFLSELEKSGFPVSQLKVEAADIGLVNVQAVIGN